MRRGICLTRKIAGGCILNSQNTELRFESNPIWFHVCWRKKCCSQYSQLLGNVALLAVQLAAGLTAQLF